jgi:hypothetical protein
MRRFLKDYQVREMQTTIAQTAGGLRNRGFRAHKSPAIYAFSTPSYCYKLPMKYSWSAVRNFDAFCTVTNQIKSFVSN